MKPLLLRLHRWTTLVFALPLALLIITGLILSLEPIVQDVSSRGVTLTAERLVSALEKHDPEGKARGISVRAYENRMILLGAGPDGSLDLDLTTGDIVNDDDRTMLSDIFGGAKDLHEHFIFDLRWVVTASTIAMVVLIVLGIFMGWPRIRNTFSGWHQGMAWGLLPFLALSPITGLMLAYGVSFTTLAPQDKAALPPLKEAVQLLGKNRDLGGLIWLRQRGGRLLARVNEGGAFRVYQVARTGVTLTSTNWPRGLHEGNVAGFWTGIMVLLTSFGFVGLMITGLTLWVRRTFRKRNRVRQAVS
jgi:uncharacterized iron-regulated membrane protein